MNGRLILTVALKELRETLRDRRTLIIMIVVPALLYPGMMIFMEQLTLFGQREMERDPVTIAVVGSPPPEFRLLERDPMLNVVQPGADPVERLRARGLDAVLHLPEAGWRPDTTNRVSVTFDATRDRSRLARRLVDERLGELRDTLLAGRLAGAGLDQSFVRPVVLNETSIATPEQLGGYTLGRFLPLVLILMTILGAFYPAIDMAAGEKERGTLETLLTAAVPADHIVSGKFIAAALIAFTAAAVNLLSMLLTFQSGLVRFTAVMDVQFQLPFLGILVSGVVLMLLAVLFAALFLGISVRAHSFKEAQNALTPVYVLSLLPAILPMMPGVQFNLFTAVLPVGGVAFLLRDLLSGEVLSTAMVIALGATVIYTMLALIFAAAAFGREDILFGGGKSEAVRMPWRERLRLSRAGEGKLTRGEAFGLVATVALLYFYLARPLMMRFGESGLMVAQVLLLALPVLLLVGLRRHDPRRALALRSAPPRAYLAGLLILAGGIPLGWTLVWLQSLVLPLPVEFLAAMEQLVVAEDLRRMFWLLALVALTPAVCEELVFRGVLMQGLAERNRTWPAILVSALVFGAFHLSTETVIRFLPTVFLGVLLGYVVWHTRSILVGMVMHFANNALVVVILSSPALRPFFADPAGEPPWAAVLLAPVFLVLGLRLLPRRDEGVGEDVPLTDGASALRARGSTLPR